MESTPLQAIPTSGYYQTNYRAVRMRELIRMRGLFRLPLSYLAIRVLKPGAPVWMPGLRANLECGREDLSERFWQVTKPYQVEFERLGFTACGFSKITRHLMLNHADYGGISYLDPSRCHFGLLAYTRVRAAAGLADREETTFAFTAAFEQGSLNYTNNNFGFDPPPQHKVIRRASAEPATMYQRFLRDLSRRPERPRHFPDDASVWHWFDGQQIEIFRARVARGLFLRMNDAEVEAVRRKLPPPLPG